MYCMLEHLHEEPDATRSPLVLLHGFPDSPRMYDAYVRAGEREQPWLRGRAIYAIAFPNRLTHPHFPKLGELVGDVLREEVARLFDDLAAASPTGKLVVIAHDWGATYTWAYARERHPQAPIEKLVALSVGSSFRYDLGEHGLRALGWFYALFFSLPYYVRVPLLQRAVSEAIQRSAGYRGERADQLHQDCYHYWHGPLWLVRWPFALLGAEYQKPYTDFPFPVLYIRSPFDRMASTDAFERTVREREDCRFRLFEDVNHWFPEQHAERVLAEVRTFL
ncbi:alpha/beta hydrolase [Cystobacter fuscus]|uniref:alpha/beta fold hydrolase n=1 Tax=Cystobacter fuscus TaxID=43 RepID=UPI002B2D7897|nr:alpha/beta hydrolase [Cystobacter fuscus]